MRATLLALVIQTVLSLAPPLAALRAQAPSDTPDGAATSGDSPAYQQAIDAALDEYALQHYEEARSLFERAHAIDPNARTLRGLGMVEFERRRYARAKELLEQALHSLEKPLTDAQRASVLALLKRTEQFVSRYVLDVLPAHAAVRVELDGKQVALGAERALVVDAGEHKLSIAAPGFIARELALDARGGEQQRLRIELVAEHSAFPPATAEVMDAGRTREPSTLGITMASAGGALLVGATVLGTMALVKAGDAKSKQSAEGKQAHRLAIATDVVLGLGLAGAITGVVLWLRGRKHESRDPAATRVDAAWSHLSVRF